jgi:hypothetical protein
VPCLSSLLKSLERPLVWPLRQVDMELVKSIYAAAAAEARAFSSA